MTTPLTAAHKPAPADAGEPSWRRRTPHGRRFGPLYRSGYLNAFLVGRLRDGRDVALVAGTHSRHYPFFHPKSKWDDVLLVVGTHTYRVSGRNIRSLRMSLGHDTATVFYRGRAFTPGGAAMQLAFDFHLSAHVYDPRPYALGMRFLMLGMLWQPALVAGTGTLTIHDDHFPVTHVTGEVERGSLTSLRSRYFQFGFEYLAAARHDTAATYLEFRAFALQRGLAGLPLRMLLRLTDSSEALTLEGYKPQHGDTLELKPGRNEAVMPLVGHTLNLGPATIHREIVRVGTQPNVRYAFRERITAIP